MKYLKYFENNFSFYKVGLDTLIDKNLPTHIDGYLNLEDNHLYSLEGCPKKVGGDFSCVNNYLVSLKFGPEYVGGNYYCSNNQLTSLEFCPNYVGEDFDCSYNKLTSLEFCPKTVGGSFECDHNELTSLKFCPETIGGDFICLNNPWEKPIPYNIIEKFNIDIITLYNYEQRQKFGSFEFQKEYLTNNPEKCRDLTPFGFPNEIKEEFDWLFNAIDMGLM